MKFAYGYFSAVPSMSCGRLKHGQNGGEKEVGEEIVDKMGKKGAVCAGNETSGSSSGHMWAGGTRTIPPGTNTLGI